MAMHRSSTTAMTAALCLLILWASHPTVLAFADGPEVIPEARARIAANDPRAAVQLLETALASARGRDRAALLVPLRTAYAAAIRQAEAEGKRAEAEMYRDDLEILNRKPVESKGRPPAPVAASAPTTAPSQEAKKDKEPAPEVPSVAPPLPIDKPAPASTSPAPDRGQIRPLLDAPAIEQTSSAEEPAKASDPPVSLPDNNTAEAAPKDIKPPDSSLKLVAQSIEPEVEKPPVAKNPTPALTVSTEQADAAFVAEEYEKAGRLYAELAQTKALPPDRREHWAYCRSREVVRRINARPLSTSDWAEIVSEIQSIQQLCPESWLPEYLRNYASERNQGSKGRPGSNKLIVRGSSPDEQKKAPRTKPAAPQAAAPSSPLLSTPAPEPVQAPARAAAAASAPRDEPGTLETVNFSIKHSNRALAEQVAKAAEEGREAQVRRWSDPSKPIPSWTMKCEIYLYPNSEVFARETGQRP